MNLYEKKWSIKKETIWFPALPEYLSGLRILHISDVHACLYRSQDVAVELLNNAVLEPFDLCVLTGDLILNAPIEFMPFMPVIKKISKKSPVVYVQGNHETLFFNDMKKMLGHIGVFTPDNERMLLDCAYGKISVIGTRDYNHLEKTRFHGLGSLLRKNDNRFNLIISHQPQIFRYIEEKCFKLGIILSGHTHGGQIRLPYMPTLYSPNQGFFPEYGDGAYYGKHNAMYVSKGIGSTYFPFRVFNKPEVTVVRLRKYRY